MLARIFQPLAVAWLAFGIATGTSASTAHRSALTREQLSGEWSPAGLLDNSVFVAAVDAQAAHHVFSGELAIPEFTLQSAPPRIHEGRLLGKDTQRFPAVRIVCVLDIRPVCS